MRVSICVLVWSLAILVNPASAHRPTMSDGTAVDAQDAIEFQDVQISRVVYHEVTADAPRVWITFEVEQPQDLFLQIGVPVLDRLRKCRPSLALIGPELPNVKLPFEHPSGLGGVVLGTRSVEKPREFHEPFTRTSSWILREERVRLPRAGRYYVVAYDPGGKPGKLWAALGDQEVWTAKDVLRMPKIITDVRRFHEVLVVGTADSKPGEERVVFDFDAPESSGQWVSVDDSVMGGVSEGDSRVNDQGVFEFKGVVSLENNGGFSSVRVRTDALNLSAYEELVFRVRGDGKRYSFSVQTNYRIMAGAYYFSFESKAGDWLEIRAPMRAFEPRSFGRPLRGAPPLNARDIRAMGFIISDKQQGAFRIEVDWIKAIKGRDDDTLRGEPVTEDKAGVVAVLIQKAIGRGVPMFNAGQPEGCAAIYEMTAGCIVALAAPDLPLDVVDTLRAGLAQAEQTADPAARAWALRNALDASLRLLRQDSLAGGGSDE